MIAERDRLSRDEAITLATTETNVPKLAIARELVQRFQTIIRNQTHSDLELWLIDAAGNLASSFAAGIKKDLLAVREEWALAQGKKADPAALRLRRSRGSRSGQIKPKRGLVARTR